MTEVVNQRFTLEQFLGILDIYLRPQEVEDNWIKMIPYDFMSNSRHLCMFLENDACRNRQVFCRVTMFLSFASYGTTSITLR
jgi:hypothetical protein